MSNLSIIVSTTDIVKFIIQGCTASISDKFSKGKINIIVDFYGSKYCKNHENRSLVFWTQMTESSKPTTMGVLRLFVLLKIRTDFGETCAVVVTSFVVVVVLDSHSQSSQGQPGEQFSLNKWFIFIFHLASIYLTGTIELIAFENVQTWIFTFGFIFTIIDTTTPCGVNCSEGCQNCENDICQCSVSIHNRHLNEKPHSSLRHVTHVYLRTSK